MRPISALFAFLLLLAACGGTTPSTADSDTTTQTDAPAAQTSAATEAAADAGGGGDGGSGGDNACLNTVEEVSAAFGVEVTEAENTPDSSGGASCWYYTDQAASESALYTTLVTGAAAQSVFDSWAGDGSAEAVSGIGDEAVWVGDTSLFIVRNGDRVLSMAGGSIPAAADEAAIRAILEDLARTASERL